MPELTISGRKPASPTPAHLPALLLSRGSKVHDFQSAIFIPSRQSFCSLKTEPASSGRSQVYFSLRIISLS